MATDRLELAQIQASVRLEKGYRYLDRCGEALLRLEEVLDDSWVPTEIAPSGGKLRNWKLGLAGRFDTNLMQVQQVEYVDTEVFNDQFCKMFDVLRSVFGIDRIRVPSIRFVFQRPFPTLEEAEQFLRELSLAIPSDRLLHYLEGERSAESFVVCTERIVDWRGVAVPARRRFEARALKQERQPDFDDRLVVRLQTLSQSERKALSGLVKLRKQHVSLAAIAAQLDVENSLESDFKASHFGFADFLEQSWGWAATLPERLGQK